MAITVDDATGHGSTGANNVITWNHTCTGTNRFLMVMAHYNAPGGNLMATPTFNGVNMTQLGTTQQQASLGANTFDSCWYMINPPTGSNVVSITASSSAAATELIGSSVSYAGVLQTGSTIDSSAQSTGSGATSFTAATTVVASNCWLIAGYQVNATPSAGAGTTIRNTETGGGADIADSNGVVGTGSQSLTVNFASGAYVYWVASLASDGISSVSVNYGMTRMLLGVGT